MIPSEFLQLPREERAFIVAAIEIKMDQEKKQQAKMKKPKKR